jgi:hypothetical protein
MAKILPFGKTFLLHGSTSPSWQNLFTSWLNFYLMAKPFSFIAKPFPFSKTFLFLG